MENQWLSPVYGDFCLQGCSSHTTTVSSAVLSSLLPAKENSSTLLRATKNPLTACKMFSHILGACKKVTLTITSWGQCCIIWTKHSHAEKNPNIISHLLWPRLGSSGCPQGDGEENVNMTAQERACEYKYEMRERKTQLPPSEGYRKTLKSHGDRKSVV